LANKVHGYCVAQDAFLVVERVWVDGCDHVSREPLSVERDKDALLDEKKMFFLLVIPLALTTPPPIIPRRLT